MVITLHEIVTNGTYVGVIEWYFTGWCVCVLADLSQNVISNPICKCVRRFLNGTNYSCIYCSVPDPLASLVQCLHIVWSKICSTVITLVGQVVVAMSCGVGQLHVSLAPSSAPPNGAHRIATLVGGRRNAKCASGRTRNLFLHGMSVRTLQSTTTLCKCCIWEARG